MEEQEKQKTDEPNIHVFGQEFDDWKKKRREERERRQESRFYRYDHCPYCYHHRGSGLWGLVILLAGLLLLANSIGLVPWEIWRYIWPFWPALLVIFGLRIILGRIYGAEGLIILAALALFGFIIIYGLVHVSSPLVRYLPSGLVNYASSTDINYFK